MDNSFYVTVAASGCVGCGACVAVAPEVFKWHGDGTVFAVNESLQPGVRPLVQKAANLCPKSIIFLDDEE